MRQENPKTNHPIDLFPSTNDKNAICKTTNYHTNAKNVSKNILRENQIRGIS